MIGLLAALFQRLAIIDGDMVGGIDRDVALGLEVAHRLVDRLAGGADDAGNIVLRQPEPDAPSAAVHVHTVRIGELQEPLRDAPVDILRRKRAYPARRAAQA